MATASRGEILNEGSMRPTIRSMPRIVKGRVTRKAITTVRHLLSLDSKVVICAASTPPSLPREFSLCPLTQDSIPPFEFNSTQGETVDFVTKFEKALRKRHHLLMTELAKIEHLN